MCSDFTSPLKTLSFGCLFSDRIEALLDRRVQLDGYDLNIQIREAQGLFRSVLREGALDVAELSIASHIAAVARGRRDYVALPVFLSRSFRHSNLYIRSDRGIEAPCDLAGKAIGIVDFQQTASVWMRGILADHYGLERKSVRWVAAGLTSPVLTDRAPTSVAEGIVLERSSLTLDTMLRDGTLDAVISPGAPPCHGDAAVQVERMWPDAAAAEYDWWQATGLFPIMHVLVVRRSLLEQDSGLASALVEAFEAARQIAAREAQRRDFPKIMLPWLNAHAQRTQAMMDGQPWTYGLDNNRQVLDTLLAYAKADGLAPAGMAAEDLFF